MLGRSSTSYVSNIIKTNIFVLIFSKIYSKPETFSTEMFQQRGNCGLSAQENWRMNIIGLDREREQLKLRQAEIQAVSFRDI